MARYESSRSGLWCVLFFLSRIIMSRYPLLLSKNRTKKWDPQSRSCRELFRISSSLGTTAIPCTNCPWKQLSTALPEILGLKGGSSPHVRGWGARALGSLSLSVSLACHQRSTHLQHACPSSRRAAIEHSGWNGFQLLRIVFFWVHHSAGRERTQRQAHRVQSSSTAME